jgi:hypothetical protein
MKKIFIFCFSLLCCFIILFRVSGQEGRIKGLRVGYDLTRTALLYFEPERKAYEFSADFEVKQNYYISAEYGRQQVDLKKPGYNYTSDGYFTRFGLDYNFSKNKMDVNAYEMVYGGFRYGFANYSHTATDINVAGNYWGIGSVAGLPSEDLSAHWFEIVAGIRGELFKNCFFGWSFRGRVMLWQKKDAAMHAYNIPGYGAGNKKSQLGFNYSIYYRIPLYTTKK